MHVIETIFALPFLVFLVGMFALQIFTAREELLGIAISLVIWFILAWWLTDAIKYLGSLSSVTWVMIIITYIAGGVVWMIYKWDRFISRNAKKLKDPELDDMDRRTIVRKLNNTGNVNDDQKLNVKAKNHKERLTVWGMCWPFSLFWTFLEDWIIRFWEHVTEWLGGLLDRIATAKLKDIN